MYLLSAGRDFFFGLRLLYQAPPGCGFEMQPERGYVHCSEDVGDRIQCSLTNWTNGQEIWTCEQLSSTAREIYSSVRNARDLGVHLSIPRCLRATAAVRFNSALVAPFAAWTARPLRSEERYLVKSSTFSSLGDSPAFRALRSRALIAASFFRRISRIRIFADSVSVPQEMAPVSVKQRCEATVCALPGQIGVGNTHVFPIPQVIDYAAV